MNTVFKLFILTILSCRIALANELISIDAKADIALNLGDQLEYFIDTSSNLSLEEILSQNAEEWTYSEKATPNFGYSNNSYWFRFNLRNLDRATTDYILAIQYPLLDHLEFYQLNQQGVIRKFTTGDLYPFEQRPIKNRNFLFPLTLAFQESSDIYVRIKTQGASQLPIKLFDAERFMLADQDEQFVKAIYYGMLLVFVIYNLFLFISIKERPYIYYVCYILLILALTSGAHGYLFQYVFPDNPALLQRIILLTVPGAMIFACLFTSSFLRLAIIAPRLNKTLIGLSVASGLSCIGAFFLPYSISTTVSLFLSIPSSLLILFTGPYAWKLGQSPARYFSLAWLFVVIGIVVGATSKFGLIPRNLFTEYAINWGAILEALFLSFALADRFNQEKNARFKAQQERLEEIEQRKEVETKLYHQATHQPINGFPNMVILQKTLLELIHNNDIKSRDFSLCLISLARMHEINKTLGHGNADLILSIFSERLQGLSLDPESSIQIEKIDDVSYNFCNLGGVLFAHIFRANSTNQVGRYAQHLKDQLAEPIEFNGMRLDLGVSIGLVSYPIHGSDVATLIRHGRVAVDVAAKANPPITIYSSELNPYSPRRLALMGELRKAISENSLELYFQPITDCKSNEVFGAEALLRWHHPQMGFIPPDEFIALAEKTGIIDPLTKWVMNEAVKVLQSWLSAGMDLTVSINISPVNLQDSQFVSDAVELIQHYQVPAERVVLEVTETAVMKNPENAMYMLNALADHGFKIAMDDFGTGHSSLSYIRSLPVYEVKIDRSFVMNMMHNNNDALITQTALNLSHDLGYKVVAEGVENEEIKQELSKMGCDFTQGYHIARPMPEEDFKDWMAQDELSDEAQDEAPSNLSKPV